MAVKLNRPRVYSWAVFLWVVICGGSHAERSGPSHGRSAWRGASTVRRTAPLSVTTSTDFTWTPAQRQAYSEISKLRLQPGRALLAREPQNGISLYLSDYADMLQLLVAEDRAVYDQIEDQEAERLKKVRKLDDASPWNRFIQAEIKLHWAFVKTKFGHETAGAYNVIQAYRLLRENARRFPQFLPNQKALGLLHVLIGSTPDSYRWVTNLLGLRGNVTQGLRELQTVAQRDALFADEARLMESLIQVYILRADERQLMAFRDFLTQRSDNLLLRFFGTAALIKEGYSEAAWALLASRPKGPEYLAVPFFEYYRGEILLQKGQYGPAFGAFQTFLNQHRGQNFRKDATYKQALCHWLQNDETRARTLLDRVREVGETTVEPDKVAQRFAEQFTEVQRPDREAVQKALMRARLAFDGGYYEQAMKSLENFSEARVPQVRDRAELAYRRARIFHRSADSAQATAAYQRALTLSEGQPWYFGATAALQLGYFCQNRGQKEKARAFFEKALAFRKHEYKNSVDNKAKAALNALGY